MSYETEAFLKTHPQVTGAMVGEGEETFLELCENYAKRVPERRRGRWISRESRESCTVPERAS